MIWYSAGYYWARWHAYVHSFDNIADAFYWLRAIQARDALTRDGGMHVNENTE